MAVTLRRLGLLCLLRLALAASDATCAAGGEGCWAAGEYYWPNARGNLKVPGVTNFTFRKNLNDAIKWTWTHPQGQYATVCYGHMVDENKDVYVSCENGVRRLRSSDGKELWFAKGGQRCFNVASLVDGKVVNACGGEAYAVDKETGKELWRTKVAPHQGGDTAYIHSHNGRVHFAANMSINKYSGGNTNVYSVNATTGEKLWEYHPTEKYWKGIWNYMPFFPGDGSLIFMDWSGGVYRLSEETGEELWHAYPPKNARNSFTDGGVGIGPGPDGMTAYACANYMEGHPGNLGVLRAYRISDGEELWEQDLPEGCTSWPVIHQEKSLGFVPAANFVSMPPVMSLPHHWPLWSMGLFHKFSLALGKWLRWVPGWTWIPRTRQLVLAFNTTTGQLLAQHELPAWERLAPAGDEEGYPVRVVRSPRAICLPAAMSCPTLDGDNNIWVTEASGGLYKIKYDIASNAFVDEEHFQMASASLHGSVSMAPGQVAVASCDNTYVFHE